MDGFFQPMEELIAEEARAAAEYKKAKAKRIERARLDQLRADHAGLVKQRHEVAINLSNAPSQHNQNAALLALEHEKKHNRRKEAVVTAEARAKAAAQALLAAQRESQAAQLQVDELQVQGKAAESQELTARRELDTKAQADVRLLQARLGEIDAELAQKEDGIAKLVSTKSTTDPGETHRAALASQATDENNAPAQATTPQVDTALASTSTPGLAEPDHSIAPTGNDRKDALAHNLPSKAQPTGRTVTERASTEPSSNRAAEAVSSPKPSAKVDSDLSRKRAAIPSKVEVTEVNGMDSDGNPRQAPQPRSRLPSEVSGDKKSAPGQDARCERTTNQSSPRRSSAAGTKADEPAPRSGAVNPHPSKPVTRTFSMARAPIFGGTSIPKAKETTTPSAFAPERSGQAVIAPDGPKPTAQKRTHSDCIQVSIPHNKRDFFRPEYPDTLHVDGDWYLIRCALCLATSAPANNNSKPFYGITALAQHVTEVHKKFADFRDIMPWCRLLGPLHRADIGWIARNGVSPHVPLRLSAGPSSTVDSSRDPRLQNRNRPDGPASSLTSAVSTAPPSRSVPPLEEPGKRPEATTTTKTTRLPHGQNYRREDREAWMHATGSHERRSSPGTSPPSKKGKGEDDRLFVY